MPLAFIRPMGENGLYHIHVVDAVDPGWGGGRPGGVDPGYGHGGGFRPDQGLPGGGHISNRPPGSGNPAFPDHTLPSGPPPHVPAGTTVVLVRDPAGVWHYATLPPGTPPPTITPPIATPPPTAGQPLPPTAAPKA